MDILFLTSKFPFPLDQGDKLRAYWQIRHLSQFHRVFLCALSQCPIRQKHIAELSFCTDIRIIPYHIGNIVSGLAKAKFSILPYQVGYFFSTKVRREIRAYLEQVQPDMIFCQLIRLAPLIENETVPVVLDYMDSLSERVRQKGNYPALPGFFLKSEFNRTLAYEKQLLEKFAAFLVTTARDRSKIDPQGKSEIFISGNGIDQEIWRPQERSCDYELLFAGNLSYGPNILGAESLVKEVLPHVRQQLPQTRVLLAGANPRRRVRRLRSSQVQVSGYVPSMPNVYAAGKIFVAPMWTGTGIQNKVLQALAMGKPCVISPLVAEGFDPSIHHAAVVAESPKAIAKACISLLQNPSQMEDCSRKGISFVQKHHRWESIISDLERIIRDKISGIPA